jgi:hypothetical protein
MEDIIKSVSTRELASAICLCVFAAYVLTNDGARSATGNVLRAFFQPIIVVPLGLAAIYAIGEIVLLQRIGWWSVVNLKTTIVWFVTFAFVAMFELVSIKDRKIGLRKIALDIFSVAAVLTFITELHSFPLLVELVAIPTVTFIVLMAELAKLRPEHSLVARPLGCIAVLIGVGYLGFSIWATYKNWRETATWATALEFLIPIVLSLGFIPFLYGWRLFVAYSEAFSRISAFGISKKLVPYARWLAITRIRGNVELLDRWRRVIQTARPSNRTELRHSLEALLVQKERELSPPVVQARDGWSPYLAMRYMSDHGLDTGHYHHSFADGWYASSPMREIGNSVGFPSNIAYYVEGSEHAATTLKIKLNVNDTATAQESEELFAAYCMHLLEQAVSRNAVERMKARIAELEEFEEEIPFGSIEMSRDEFVAGNKGGYSRKFEIRRGTRSQTRRCP